MSLVTPRLTTALSIPDVRELIEGLLRAAGCPQDVATEAADVFVEAELQGNWIQGLHYLHTQINSLRTGKIDPRGRPQVLRDGPAFAFLTGNRGPGQLAGNAACDLVCRKASSAGCAAVGVTNSSDIFMLSYYAERITRHGLIAIVMINSPPTMHAVGGIERTLGTNPFAFGVPTAGPHAVLFDTASSAELSARVKIAAYYGETLAEDVAIDAQGRPTRDPTAALTGAVSPYGGAVGYGIALMVAFISGCLLGNAVGQGQAEWSDLAAPRANPKGHLYMAVHPEFFAGLHPFRKATSSYLQKMAADPVATHKAAQIRVPGQRAFEARRRALTRGSVVIDEYVWEKTAALASDLGVRLPLTTIIQ